MQEQAAKRNAATLTTWKRSNELVVGRTAQGVHGALNFGVEFPSVEGINFILDFALARNEFIHFVGVRHDLFIHKWIVDFFVFREYVYNFLRALEHDIAHRFIGVELRLLWQIAYGVTRREDDIALKRFIESGNDFHDRRLTRTIQTNDADFGTVKEG